MGAVVMHDRVRNRQHRVLVRVETDPPVFVDHARVDLDLGTVGLVGIGTTTPGAKLEVSGQVKITGGTPGVDKVLVSDAAGLASWGTVATAGITDGACGGAKSRRLPTMHTCSWF